MCVLCVRVCVSVCLQDVLSVFKGRWDIKSVKDESGKVVGCDAELNQDVLPRGEVTHTHTHTYPHTHTHTHTYPHTTPTRCANWHTISTSRDLRFSSGCVRVCVCVCVCAGIPKITQHVPLLGELLRSVSYRAIKRVMEDMNAAIEKVRTYTHVHMRHVHTHTHTFDTCAQASVRVQKHVR